MKTSLHTLILLTVSLISVFADEAIKSGSIDKDGNLIIHVFKSVLPRQDTLPVALRDDYGFMIFNNGSLENPKLLILIGSKKDKKIHEAVTWHEAEKIVANVPRGSIIHYYGQCSVHTYYGLPDNTWGKFMKLIRKQKLIYNGKQDRLTCVCSLKG